jgi:membrane protease YdiL (CAAX protease family)
MVGRYPLTSFFVLTFALAWLPLIGSALGWFPPILLAFGPSLAAVIVTAVATGRSGLRDLLRRVILWRVRPGWYAVALLASIPFLLAVVYVNVLLGARPPTTAQFGAWGSLGVLFLVYLINPFGGAWEELGWRGYALPRLQGRHTPLVASVILGVLWSAWHLPMFISGMIAWPMALTIMAMSVVWTALFNQTRGSALIAFLFHVAFDATGDWTFAMFQGADRVGMYWLMAVGAVVVAAAIVILGRRTWLTRMPVTPGDPRVEAEVPV